MKLPPLLDEIPDKPISLNIEGELPDPEIFTYLTVVGSRHPTNYGIESCRTLISGLAGLPIVIVSGLAVGIDSCAHKSALEFGLPTVAVPGSGLDRSVLYPQTNIPLAEEILKSGGALLSEFDRNASSMKYMFPARNRIMAGMSKAVLVIEAGKKSGTLITARLALDYNRDVYVVPGSIFSDTSAGSNWLISQGAGIVTGVDGLRDLLGFAGRMPKEYAPPASKEESIVLDMLSEPREKDEILRELGYPAHIGISLIAAMEIKGLITERMGLIRRLD